MEDRRRDMLRHFHSILRRWNGADAQLTELTTSHRTLRLFLRLPNQNGYLLIACIDPLHINAPTAWSNAQMEVSIHEQDGFLVCDEATGVRIHTGSVEVKEFG